MIRFFNYLLRFLFQYLPAALLILSSLIILYVILLRILRIQINNPIIKFIIDLLGLHFLDSSPFSLEFHNYLKLITDYSNKVIISIKPDEMEEYIVENTDNKNISQNINWAVFSDSIVLNIKRSFLFSDNWKTLLKLLNCYRTSQPINAVLFGMYFDEEIDGKNLIRQFDLIKYCSEYPFYLIILDSKKVADISSIFPEPIVVGWSTEEIIDKTNYSLTEANQIRERIIEHISNKFKQALPLSASPDLALIPFNLSKKLETRLSLLTDLFYNKLPFFLRGVYLTDLAFRDRKYLDPLIFDLVFKENLVNSNNSPKTKYLAILHYFFLITISIILLLLPITYRGIVNQSENLKTALESLVGITSFNSQDISKNLTTLARYLPIIKDNQLVFPNIPVSWGNSLNRKITKYFVEIYYNLIIKQVIKTWNEILDKTSKNVYEYRKIAFVESNFIDTPELQDVYSFVKHVLFLKKLQKSILRMSKSSDLIDFSNTINLLTGNNIPKEYFSYPEFYREVRKLPLPEILNFDSKAYSLNEILVGKMNTLFSALNKNSHILNTLQKIATNLDILQNDLTFYSSKDLLDLNSSLNLLKKSIASSKWLTQKEIVVSDQFADIFTSVEEAFGSNTAKDSKNKFDLNLSQLRERLLSFQVPIYGNLMIIEGDRIELNNKLEYLMNFINSLEQVNLKSYSNNLPSLNFSGNEAKELDLSKIQSILFSIEKVEEIIKNNGDSLPSDIKINLVSIVKSELSYKVVNDLVKLYEERSLQDSGDFGLLNLVDGLPNLFKILKFLKDNNKGQAFAELKNSINRKYAYLLDRLYSELQDKNIYSINSVAILNTVTTEEIINSFIQSNRNQLESYYNKTKLVIDKMSAFYRENEDMTPPKITQEWNYIMNYFVPNTDVSLEVLENYIRKSLRARNVQDLALVLQNRPKLAVVDFVGKRIEDVSQVIKNKIVLTIGDEIATLFYEIRDIFNENALGYFPFDNQNAPDISKAKFRNLYQFFLNNKSRIQNFLSLVEEDKSFEGKEWFKFIKEFYEYMNLLENLVFSGNPGIIKIRDLTNPERNISNLTIWKISIKSDSQIDYIEDEKNIESLSLLLEMNKKMQVALKNLNSIDMVQKIADTSDFVFSDNNKKFIGSSDDGPFCLIRFINRYYSYQDKDTIFLSVKNAVTGTAPNRQDEFIGWISIKCPGVKYCKAPFKVPEFTGL